ncbi:MAG: hypothetical protein QOE28_230 [Solirubrobacteraceae bacterium]|nr:hypothetical protein [Solirubrobacteraceae bacterium]
MIARVRSLAALVATALAATMLMPILASQANFNSRSQNPGNRLSADTPANYLHVYSQGSDPAGLTGYAVKRLSAPAVPAATGSDLGLAVALGGNKNVKNQAFTRVLALQAPAVLPAGMSPLTVTASLAADAASGRQPISGLTFSNTDGTGSAATATLAAGAKKQLNLVVTTQAFPGNNVLHTPTITLTITYPGYSGTFLTYVVPVSVWDGNGVGP